VRIIEFNTEEGHWDIVEDLSNPPFLVYSKQYEGEKAVIMDCPVVDEGSVNNNAAVNTIMVTWTELECGMKVLRVDTYVNSKYSYGQTSGGFCQNLPCSHDGVFEGKNGGVPLPNSVITYVNPGEAQQLAFETSANGPNSWIMETEDSLLHVFGSVTNRVRVCETNPVSKTIDKDIENMHENCYEDYNTLMKIMSKCQYSCPHSWTETYRCQRWVAQACAKKSLTRLEHRANDWCSR